MPLYQCDWCAKEEQGEDSLMGALPPLGWDLVPAVSGDAHFCSEACRADWSVLESKTAHLKDSYIYILQRGPNGPIKIGFTRNTKRRFGELQRQSAEPLLIRAIYYGSQQCEAYLHGELAAFRMNGEWFLPEALDHAHERYWRSAHGRIVIEAKYGRGSAEVIMGRVA